MERAVVPSIRDDIQLSVEIYRSKLYELIASRKNRVRNHVARVAQHNKNVVRESSCGGGRENEEMAGSSMSASCHSIDQESSEAGKVRHRSVAKNGLTGHNYNRKSMELLNSNSSLKTCYDSVGVDSDTVNTNSNTRNGSVCGSNGSRMRSNSVSTPLHRSRSELRNSKSGNCLSSSLSTQSKMTNGIGNRNSSHSNVIPIDVPKNRSPPRIAFSEKNNNGTIHKLNKNSVATTGIPNIPSSPPLEEKSKSCSPVNNNYNNNNKSAIKVKVISRRIDNQRGTATSSIYMNDNQHHSSTSHRNIHNHQQKQHQDSNKTRLSPAKSWSSDKSECLSGKSSLSSSTSSSHSGNSDQRVTRRSTTADRGTQGKR